ncbi:copper amine oxidase-like protein [Paenibacillus cellulosilyticus]|uniref:Copper amine oxidase-like protein n=1 Tax=Paenibacillus cellulosilyticus TaxID=375489 RepID=A0A2V2YZT1_9BACL|nr:DUF4163 domain-containing protein [Paenibacillus cellulosilyticus]PWW08518.1 copper amine oxidase-like protein [Paenibacillus cellulosilyticus]QKS48097.1 DUF4163 domain-containing protein [Paenibacillus cellulosilyticus]
MKSPFRMITLAAVGSCLLAAAPLSAFAETVTAVPISAPIYETAVPISAPVTAVPISAISIENARAVTVTTKLIEENTDLLSAKLSIPVISGLQDTAYQEKLNSEIEKQATDTLAELKTQAEEDKKSAAESGYEYHPYEMIVEYEVKSDGSQEAGGIFSMTTSTYTYTGGAHGGTFEAGYNVLNGTEAQAITLEQALGEGGFAKADSAVRYQIKQDPDRFYTDILDTFTGVTEDTQYYYENGIVQLVFQQYDVAPYAGGIVIVPVTEQPTAAASFTIDADKLAAGPKGTKLVPLRQAAEALGFKVAWNGTTHSAELSRGAQWTQVTVGQNSYFFNRVAPFELSAAPTIVKGSLYVPLDFFDQVLKLSVSEENGTVQITG